MNQEILKLWIADLRANGAKQGSGMLSSNGKDCCLGRLCWLAVQAGVVEYALDGAGNASFFSDYGLRSECTLPQAVIDWVGATSRDPELAVTKRLGNVETCTGANDGVNDPAADYQEQPLTFDQIADLLWYFYGEPERGPKLYSFDEIAANCLRWSGIAWEPKARLLALYDDEAVHAFKLDDSDGMVVFTHGEEGYHAAHRSERVFLMYRSLDE